MTDTYNTGVVYVNVLEAQMAAVDLVQPLDDLAERQGLLVAADHGDRAQRVLASKVRLGHALEVLAYHELRGKLARAL